MQKLFALSFALMIAAALFVGHALSKGHAPVLGGLATCLYVLGMFLPFLSEYNVLHRGFSSIGDNFKSLVNSREDTLPQPGEVEILMPSSHRTPAQTYHLDHEGNVKRRLLIVLLVASTLFVVDAVDFYILGDGLKVEKGPISNF